MVNRRYEDIKVGEKASFTKTVTEADVVAFAGITGDFNPVHINAEYAKKSFFKERIAHGILTAGFISAALGTQLPGPNSIYLKQDLSFTAPVKLGDTVTATVEVTAKRDDKKLITLSTVATNQRGEVVVKGEALIKKMDPED
ncbi:MaoC family dehydratase [Gelria sp. Kuro-4]|uniref:MaoC family dehydratase n=1 Tax=Gelria sp. Kuro-4 TaxID=2796927 RepID=UPI001BEF3C40|nr:MaoC family dehydratase [Gelria sp. Kuro-4]BCV23741.1 3-hydroxybutyryl-CoA dehydratase [Gelria sp. Kuro-4]